MKSLAEQTTELTQRLGKAYLEESDSTLFSNNSELYLSLRGLEGLIRLEKNRKLSVIFNSGDSYVGLRKNYSGVDVPPSHVLMPQTAVVLSHSYDSHFIFSSSDWVERIQFGDKNFLVRGLRIAEALSRNGFLYTADREQVQEISQQTVKSAVELLA